MNPGFLSYLEACIDTSFTPILTGLINYSLGSAYIGCLGPCTNNGDCACIGG